MTSTVQTHPANLQVVVGLGKTGLSCVRYLVKQGYPIAVTDSRDTPPGLEEMQNDFPHIPLVLGHFDAALCLQAARLIVSPGVSLREPAVAQAITKGIPAIGDIELFALATSMPIVAITGSNGKSTVTTLVGEMAQTADRPVKVGGNLGTPALDLLGEPQTNLYVLELSSFQLETTYSLAAAAAVLLNLSEDHMDRYETMQHYLQAKQKIYQQCKVAIINRDEPAIWQNLPLNANKIISFGLDAPQPGHFGLRTNQAEDYLAFGEALLLKTSALKIQGRHQLANALAALALGYAVNLPMAAMLSTLSHFAGLPHRCQWIANKNGVAWYNDSKATNVASANASIAGLGQVIPGKMLVIAGGLSKNADFSPLRTTMTDYVKTLILIGKDAPYIESQLSGSTAIQQAATLLDAIEIAYAQAQAGDAVILAPACASFDMFKNFEHRGEVFMELVKAHR